MMIGGHARRGQRMVRVGFFSEAVVKAEPSTTNTFFTSCIWQKPVEAERFGVLSHAARSSARESRCRSVRDGCGKRDDLGFRAVEISRHVSYISPRHAALVFADAIADTSDRHTILIERRAFHRDAIVAPSEYFAIGMQGQNGRDSVLSQTFLNSAPKPGKALRPGEVRSALPWTRTGIRSRADSRACGRPDD